MLIGKGLMANLFQNYKNDSSIVVFASGVSNSNETSPSAFFRERNLLEDSIINNPNSLLVYFSTCSIYNTSMLSKPYVQHKLDMENLIKDNFSKYLICRISNVVGFNGNSNTIINFLIEKITNNQNFDVWKNAQRNLIGADDVKYIVHKLIRDFKESKTVNIASKTSIDILDIIKQIEIFTNKKANTNLVDIGEKVNIDIRDIEIYLDEIETRTNGIEYFKTLLNNYYSV
ncbi:NAD-dependent epimerase [Winogradskyella litorisediminis]|uniref:NAD-dependent epimerase n=1 Tax=Winogradskyella litorisediminis TaxID=1156618 RepID=A0ABW3N9X2_9FLAO